MNFYKYQNKLMSICEKMPFKCTECFQSFLTPTDLQCHVYDRHQQLRDAPGPECKQEEEMACETNGTAAEKDDGETEKPIKEEKQDDVNVKMERNDEKDVDEDEELIDVGVNNRTDEKTRADLVDTHWLQQLSLQATVQCYSNTLQYYKHELLHTTDVYYYFMIGL